MSVRTLVLLCLGLALAGCGGGGGGGGSVPSAPPDPRGQALLGPLAGADVDVYALSNLTGSPVLTTTTVDSTDLVEAGRFLIPEEVIDDAEVYLIKVTGGVDIDANDDGVLDDVPTPNAGALRAIVTPEQIRRGDYRVNALTEVAYQRALPLLRTGHGAEAILSEVEGAARMLLLRSIDRDGDRDIDDLLAWRPVRDRAAIRRPGPDFDRLITAVHANDTDEVARISAILTEPIADSIDLGSSSTMGGVVTRNGIAYVAHGHEGLQAIDVSDPENPLTLGLGAFNPSEYWVGLRVALDGNFVYVLAQGFDRELVRLHVFDLDDPENPDPRGVLDVPGQIGDAIVVRGGTAYLPLKGFGLQVVDVSDPDLPVAGAVIDLGEDISALDAAILGNHIYVAAVRGGIQIFSLANPAVPAFAGEVTSLLCTGIDAADGLVYAVDVNPTLLMVFDATDPVNLVERGAAPTLGRGMKPHVVGNRAYVGDIDFGLFSVDVSDPDQPFLEDVYTVPGLATGVAVAGDYVLVPAVDFGTGFMGLNTVLVDRARNHALPMRVEGLDRAIVQLAARGAHAYVLGNDVQIVDMTDPAAPNFLMDLEVRNGDGSIERPMALTVDGGFLYVVLRREAQVFDLVDPANPVFRGRAQLPYGAERMVAAAGTRVYVTVSEFGAEGVDYWVQIIDVSNPDAPALGTLLELPRPSSLAGDGVLLAVADFDDDLTIIDVTDVDVPVVRDTEEIGTFPLSMAMADGFVYASTFSQGQVIVDARDPDDIQVLAGARREGGRSIALGDSLLYHGNTWSDVRAYDVSAPPTTTPTGFHMPVYQPLGIAIGDGFVIVEGVHGLYVSRTSQRDVP